MRNPLHVTGARLKHGYPACTHAQRAGRWLLPIDMSYYLYSSCTTPHKVILPLSHIFHHHMNKFHQIYINKSIICSLIIWLHSCANCCFILETACLRVTALHHHPGINLKSFLDSVTTYCICSFIGGGLVLAILAVQHVRVSVNPWNWRTVTQLVILPVIDIHSK